MASRPILLRLPAAPKPRASINTFTEGGANIIAERIRAYWRSQGHDVRVLVTRESNVWSAPVIVISDLVDGLPSAKQSPAQRERAKAALEQKESAA